VLRSLDCRHQMGGSLWHLRFHVRIIGWRSHANAMAEIPAARNTPLSSALTYALEPFALFDNYRHRFAIQYCRYPQHLVPPISHL
jgi:hypothetical protein